MKDVAEDNRRRLSALKKALEKEGVPPLHELRTDKKKRDRHKSVIKRITSRINNEFPLIDRCHRKGKKFKLSLAIGEMVQLYDKERCEKGIHQPELFHVVEVKKASKASRQAENKVVVVPHWDARRAKGKGVDNPRIEYELSAGKIQELIVEIRRLKARVDPLGRIRWAND